MIILQVGQCGNQVGYHIYDMLYNLCNEIEDENIKENTLNKYFFYNEKNNRYNSKSLLIDAEPKVIHTINQKTLNKEWKHNTNNIITGQSGSGNNWAIGYNSEYSHILANNTIEKLRKEMEKCDYNDHIMFIHSMAGGTGSGLGTLLTEQVSDYYSDVLISSNLISPYSSGEVTIQSYNATLTLSKISQISDCIFLWENDKLNRICQLQKNIKQPLLKDLNNLIAIQLANILLPSNQYIKNDEFLLNNNNKNNISNFLPTFITKSLNFNNLITHLCPINTLPFITLSLLPQMSDDAKSFSSDSFSGLLPRALAMLKNGIDIERDINWSLNSDEILLNDLINNQNYNNNLNNNNLNNLNKIISSAIILRGENSSNLIENYLINNNDNLITKSSIYNLSTRKKELLYLKSFNNMNLYPSWNNNFHLKHILSFSNNIFNSYTSSILLAKNSQSIIPILNNILDKTYNLLSSRAYVYQYEAYNINYFDFQQSLFQLEQVVQNYTNLSF